MQTVRGSMLMGSVLVVAMQPPSTELYVEGPTVE